MRSLAALTPMLMLVAGCADAPGPGRIPPGADIPEVAEIVCAADGSPVVRTPQVLVQPDGVHLHVVSHLDETAGLNGFGLDVDPGESNRVVSRPPGFLDEACWPFSLHGSDEEPSTHPIRVLDPTGLYAAGELQCSGVASSMIGDFAETPLEVGPVPFEEARAGIRGLEDDDEVFRVGYPEQREAGQVGVRRDGEVVATFGFYTFDGEDWVSGDAQICESSGLSGEF
jgi:hypothetical protein